MKSFRFAALLTAVMLLLAACGNGDGADTTAADGGEGANGGGDEVVMQSISFQPNEITVQPGATVTWTNEDSVSHTTTSDDELWDSGTLSPGDTFDFTFDEAGTYTYICTIHPTQMQATVIVEG